MTDLYKVDWTQIPTPVDDGGASHLPGTRFPSIELRATNGEMVNFTNLDGRIVVYAYPMTGRPDVPLPDGWDMLPGARGCTPQSCDFRDHLDELIQLGVSRIFGISTQETEYQKEAVDRLHLPFALLSDVNLLLQNTLNLPVMMVQDMTLLKRLTMIIDDGCITHVFYPVFPPHESAVSVIQWLNKRA